MEDMGGKILPIGQSMFFVGLWKWFSDLLEKKGFTLLPKPWVVQRTFGCLNWCRRLSKDYV
ncbi:Mobile element protein [Richelia intracellularis]|nr:Mobile element protein [Richelia intracellularis]